MLGICVDDARELVDEPALADSGHADERDELWRSLVPGALERAADDVELALAADELRSRLVRDVDAETGAGALRLPDRDRLGLALRLDRARLLVVDDLAGRAVRRLVREDPVHRCRVLEAGGRVDDVTGGHPFTRLRDARRAGSAPRPS